MSLYIYRYLHKLGATFHGWSKRWFVLDRQKMALIYYSDKSERKPRGGAYFSVSIQYVSSYNSFQKHNSSKLSFRSMVFFFSFRVDD